MDYFPFGGSPIDISPNGVSPNRVSPNGVSPNDPLVQMGVDQKFCIASTAYGGVGLQQTNIAITKITEVEIISVAIAASL